AVVSRHAEHGRAGPPRLQRHDGALLLSQGLRRTEEFQDFALPLPQLITQLGRQHPDRSGAPQAVAFGPDLDITAAQFSQEHRHHYSAISSRSRAPLSATPAGAFPLVTHVNASTPSASAATVGRSNRLRSSRSTPAWARSWETSRAAMSELPPRSKKLSNTPKSTRPTTPRNAASTISSVGVRGATAPARGAAPSVGAGRALRSSLPFAVRGKVSRSTNSAGTMYSGRPARMRARSRSARSAGACSSPAKAHRLL